MKNPTILTITIVALFLATSVIAVSMKVSMKEIGLLGKGLAILENDSSDVHEIKIGVASVTVSLADQNTTLTAGVLYFDDAKYRVRNITVNNKTVSGDVYLNDTQVGFFQVSLTPKNKTELWSGSLTLNSNNYNLYVLQGHRLLKADELADKVSDYCQAHHEDGNCSDKIREYCQNNPQDARCMALFRTHCRTHLEDEQCRENLKDWCTNNPHSELCKDYCELYPSFCGTPVKKCGDCPDGYKPTSDGFCAPNCGKGRKNCPHDVINCPSTTTTTTTQITTTTSQTTTTTTTTTTETTTTTPVATTTTTTPTETTTSSTTTTTAGG